MTPKVEETVPICGFFKSRSPQLSSFKMYQEVKKWDGFLLQSSGEAKIGVEVVHPLQEGVTLIPVTSP